jgi:hypothetical protein
VATDVAKQIPGLTEIAQPIIDMFGNLIGDNSVPPEEYSYK